MSIVPVDLQQSRIIGVPRDSLPTVRASLNPAPPNGGDFRSTVFSTIADRAVARYCEVRRTHPGLWSNPVDGAFNALTANLPNIFAEELCRPYDNAAPGTGASESQVVGGQCSVNYVIFVSGVNGQGLPVSQQFTLPGPIRSVTLPVTGSGLNRTWTIRTVYGPNSLVSNVSLFNTNTVATYLQSWSYTITRQDGQPDNCGNAPPVPLPPVPPQWTTPVNINVGPQQISVPITIGGPDVGNYPDFEFDPTVNIGGAIDVRIGPNEVQLVFPDPVRTVPDSIFRDFNPNINLAPAISLLSGNQLAINGNIEVIQGEIQDGIPVDLSEIEALIRACCCNPEYTYERIVLAGSSRGGIYSLPVGTVAVVCEQTAIPGRSPGSSGEGIVPDARWEGWVSFGADGKPGTRQQLQWRDSAYPVPKNCDTFLIFGLYDSSYKVTAVVETKVVPL